MSLFSPFSSIRRRLIFAGLLMFSLVAVAALFALIHFVDSYNSLNELTRQRLVTANHTRQLDEIVSTFSTRSSAALTTDDPTEYELAYKAATIAWYSVRQRAKTIPKNLFDTVGYARDQGLTRLNWLADALDQTKLDLMAIDRAEARLSADLSFDKRLEYLALEQEFSALQAEFLVALDRLALASHHLSDHFVQTAFGPVERIEKSVIQSIIVTVALLLTALLSSVILGWLILQRGIASPLRQSEMAMPASNVTERKAAEHQTQALLEAAPDAMLAMDDKGVIVLANAYTETVFGYQRQELVGAKLETLLPATFPQNHPERADAYLASPEYMRMREVTAVHKTGRTIPVEVVLNRVDTGEHQLVVVAARDISLRKQAEREIIKRTEQLQSAIDGMPTGFLMFDTEGVLRIWNQRYRELVELPDAVFKGVPTLNSIVKAQFERGDFVPLALTSVTDAQTTLKQIYCDKAARSTEQYWPSLDRHVIVSSNPLPSGGWVLIYNDISPIRKAEAELIQARDQAQDATRAKDLFLATMSHEIRTPMNGVIGMIDLLAHTSLEPDQRQMTTTIRESATALLTIINDVLDFSKIEAGKMQLETAPIVIRQIVDGVAEMMGADAMKKAIGFVCYCDPDIPPTVLGDQVRLRQILFNLLGNALKFTDAGKNVVLRADLLGFKGEGDQAIIRYQITDQGIGMTEAQVGNLFKPFQQMEASTTRRFGGTGLGLSIVWRLIKLMEGDVAVESTPNSGSTFTVTLQHEVVKGATPPSEVDLSQLRVLALVVPDPVQETLLRRYLSVAGAQVTLTHRPDDIFDAALAAYNNHLAYQVVYLGTGWPEVLKSALIERFRSHQILCDMRFVLAQPGAGKREQIADTTIMPATPMIRRNLVNAVAVAVGRARPDMGSRSDSAPIRRKAAPSAEAAMRNKELILVIEDNRTNQDVIRRQINLLGYQCEIAEDGGAGLQAIRSGRYAIALSDVHMPEMDGFEMTGKIRENEDINGDRFPIIAITANALQGEEQRCLAAGMDGYLSKPLDMKRLQAVLEHWLPHAATGPTASLPDDTVSAPICDGDVSGDKVIDVSALTDVFGDDRSVVMEILREFLPAASEAVLAMEQALDRQDAGGIAAQTHKLKSSAKAVGAHRLSSCCFQAEMATKDGDWANLTRLVPDIREQYDLAEAFITTYCR